MMSSGPNHSRRKGSKRLGVRRCPSQIPPSVIVMLPCRRSSTPVPSVSARATRRRQHISSSSSQRIAIMDEGAASSSSASPSQFETLPPRSEYRFELEAGERLSIRLVPDSGDAEIFGASLLAGNDRWYTFGEEAKACVCSWNGCQLELCESDPPLSPSS